MEAILGIDIGGSGVKGAPVDINTGELLYERFKVETPKYSKPEVVKEAVNQVVRRFNWEGSIGVGFPGLVIDGLVRIAPNMHSSWREKNVETELTNSTDLPVTVINDADAAGVAEFKFGAAQNNYGTFIVLTFGTGIGSALFRGGTLIPNTELGHLQYQGKEAEKQASADVRTLENLNWDQWAGRVNTFLQHLEMLFSPELFVIGGGISRKHEKFLHKLDTKASIEAAKLLNEAGVVGAAMAAVVEKEVVPDRYAPMY